ncbi:MAG: hypothetical protein RR614_12000 [Eubacterium sp.]
MKIALINGSPKKSKSASGILLDTFKPFLNAEHRFSSFTVNKTFLEDEQIDSLFDHDIWVFAFPLYADGIPSHLLHVLTTLEKHAHLKGNPQIAVYTFVNCGFYEGHQNAPAIEMMKNWCTKSGLVWKQGLGIGAGGMLSILKKDSVGHGPLKNLGTAFETLAMHIDQNTGANPLFITANFPRIAYKLAGEYGWRQSAKANGLKTKALFRKCQP